MPPPLPSVGEDALIVYSDWRDTPNLTDLSPEARKAFRDRHRQAAVTGHAVRLALHTKTGPNDSYTEVVSYKDPDTGGRRDGVRTVAPGGEELVAYPGRSQAITAYNSLQHTLH